MTLTPVARFHIGLINRRWYKDMLQEADVSNNTFVVVSSLNISTLKAVSLPTQFLCSTNGSDVQVEGLAAVDNEISKSISKKHKFGELWGLGRKVMVDAIEDDNEENYRELLRVFLSIQKKSQQ
ncbi:7868_t:CDS:1, partial [Funneliformis mosseae]